LLGPAVTITWLTYSQRRRLTIANCKHVGGEQAGKVIAVDPLHDHHANAVTIDEVIDVEQIVVLDLGDAGRGAGHALHGFVVAANVVEPLRREDFQRRREREVVGAAQLRQIHDALAAGTEQLEELQVIGPVQPPLAQDFLVLRDQLVRHERRGIAAVRDRYMNALLRGGEHAFHSVERVSGSASRSLQCRRATARW
jgi:hypothetical protein